jgi:Domain of unknown function (DUF4787)
MLIKLIFVVFLSFQVTAKGKSHDKIKREECQKIELCRHDPTENCELRCMSENCYIKVYGETPLEPGEVKLDKAKLFSDCFRLEEKEFKSKRINN